VLDPAKVYCRTVSFRKLKKSTLEIRAVSETALFSEKITLEKRADYKSPFGGIKTPLTDT
jgi:hypothetical protein